MDEKKEKEEKKEKDGEAPGSAEYLRKKYFYRSLIVKGRARVGESSSVRNLIGPDCAFHLYSYMKKEDEKKDDKEEPEA